MTSQTIIHQLEADGVNLALSIKAKGKPEDISRWLPVLKKNKPHLIALLQKQTSDLDDFIDAIEERAAIQQFDGGMDRIQATAEAYENIKLEFNQKISKEVK